MSSVAGQNDTRSLYLAYCYYRQHLLCDAQMCDHVSAAVYDTEKAV